MDEDDFDPLDYDPSDVRHYLSRADEDERDEYEETNPWGCRCPDECLMPDPHRTDECYTAEMAAELEEQNQEEPVLLPPPYGEDVNEWLHRIVEEENTRFVVEGDD